jgi:ribosomal protein S18 acetylase RimI-like enzyme
VFQLSKLKLEIHRPPLLTTAMLPFPEPWLSRIEDAGLNASAPTEQRVFDGWLVRFNPGKAKRARCVNALAAGRLPLHDKLGQLQAFYRELGLPLFIRITPFSEPAGLDRQLAGLGWTTLDDTRVMVCPGLDALHAEPWPDGQALHEVDSPTFAETVGGLRGSPAAQRQAQARRLAHSPVPYRGVVLRDARGELLACAQVAIEADMAGLYDVFTAPAARSQGLARRLCAHLLVQAREAGARVAYLQVEGDNAPARQVYARLGFSDAYAYHYRTPGVPIRSPG